MINPFIHTNAFSINAKKLIDPKVIDTYLPFTVDMLIRQVAAYIEKISDKKEEANFISVLLNGLEKAIFPEDMFSEKRNRNTLEY